MKRWRNTMAAALVAMAIFFGSIMGCGEDTLGECDKATDKLKTCITDAQYAEDFSTNCKENEEAYQGYIDCILEADCTKVDIINSCF